MSSKKSGRIEVYPNIHVTPEELEAHKAKLAQEAEAEQRPDMMTSTEEDE